MIGPLLIALTLSTVAGGPGDKPEHFWNKLDFHDLPGAIAALNRLGAACRQSERYAEALHYFQESLALVRKLGNRATEAKVLSLLAGVYRLTGSYAEALRHYQACLKIQRDLGDRRGEAATQNKLGFVSEAAGRDAEAESHYQEQLRLARSLGDTTGEVSAQETLGQLMRRTGRLTESRHYFEESLGGARRQNAERPPTRPEPAREEPDEPGTLGPALGGRYREVVTLNNLGTVCLKSGQHADAERYFQESLKIARELGDRHGEALALAGLGEVHRATGKFDDALKQYQEALRAAETTYDAETAIACHRGMGQVYQARKDWRAAIAAYREAIHRVELLRTHASEPSLQTALLAQHTACYRYLAVCLLEVREPAEAFDVSERVKARTLVELLQQGHADLRQGMTDAERRQEQRLQNQESTLAVQLEELRGRKADADRQAAVRRDLEKARQELDAFRRDLFLRRPDVETRRAAFAPATLADLNRTLFVRQPDLVVLSYLVGESESLLFVLRRGDQPDGPAKLRVYRLDLGAKELAEGIETFRGLCSQPTIQPDSEDLTRRLLGAADEALAGAKQVVIAPDGVLHTLPFQALQGPDGRYLIERCAVSYAPSVTALVKMTELAERRRKEPGRSTTVVAVGISDFGHRERALPAAEGEARTVASLFPDRSRLLLGTEATKARLEAAWGSGQALHLATHGRLNPTAPLYSALVLTPGGERDEGLLYARDLLNADLPCDLVVLSACETGLGREVSGEGMLGLSWAWFVAGVPATVVTQWEVGDASTGHLMRVFYEQRAAGVPKAEALRQAQLTLLKDRATRHPFYWAPFVLLGDCR